MYVEELTLPGIAEQTVQYGPSHPLFFDRGQVDELEGHLVRGWCLKRRASGGGELTGHLGLCLGRRAGRRCGCTSVLAAFLFVHGRFCLCAVVVL